MTCCDNRDDNRWPLGWALVLGWLIPLAFWALIWWLV